MSKLTTIIEALHKNDYFFRFENSEEMYVFSIINRQVYPRIWGDLEKSGDFKIITETTESLLNRLIPSEVDWEARFTSSSLELLLQEVETYIIEKGYVNFKD